MQTSLTWAGGIVSVLLRTRLALSKFLTPAVVFLLKPTLVLNSSGGNNFVSMRRVLPAISLFLLASAVSTIDAFAQRTSDSKETTTPAFAKAQQLIALANSRDASASE